MDHLVVMSTCATGLHLPPSIYIQLIHGALQLRNEIVEHG